MAITNTSGNNLLHLKGDSAEKIKVDFERSYQQSYDNAIEHFVQALEQNAPFETDGTDNLQTLKLVEDAYRLAGLPST
jgi:predicted dehydrogenase